MKRWTINEVNDLRRLVDERLTDPQVAAVLGRTTAGVMSKRRSLALLKRRTTSRRPSVWTPERVRKLESLHCDHWTDAQIAGHFGDVTERAVAVQRHKQRAVSFRMKPVTSLKSYSDGSLATELRVRGWSVAWRTS